MCILSRVVMGIVLAIQSVWDLRTKEIPTIVSLCGGLAGVVVSFISGRELKEILFACIPGVVCFLVCRVTNGAVGYGDAILLTVMGTVYSFAEIIFICVAAYSLAVFIALVLIVVFHKKRNYEIPFVPFFAFGWLMEMIALLRDVR